MPLIIHPRDRYYFRGAGPTLRRTEAGQPDDPGLYAASYTDYTDQYYGPGEDRCNLCALALAHTQARHSQATHKGE